MASRNLIASKAITLIAFAVSVYFNFSIAFGRSFHHGKRYGDRTGNTPFTANLLFVFVYWCLTYASQLIYLSNVYTPGAALFAEESIAGVGYHFSLFNILQIAWSFLFSRGHFFLSEIVLIANLFNLLALYVSHKTYSVRPFSKWLLVHIPISVLPTVWVIYAIFWNGAVWVGGATSLTLRILANIFIWDFAIIPALYLFLYGDWAVGFAFAYLTLGIAISQLFIKVIALQWIFAFIIAGLVFIASAVVAFSPSTNNSLTEGQTAATAANDERAPLINA